MIKNKELNTEAALDGRPTFETSLLLKNVMMFGKYLDGAINAVLALEPIIMSSVKGEERVYTKAIIDLILSGKTMMNEFLLGNYVIRFRNHERKNGKLVKCEAYFVSE